MQPTLKQMDEASTDMLKADQKRKIKDLESSESTDPDTFFKFGESC